MAQIEIILPDGSKINVEENSTAFDVAKSISEGLARNALAAKINDKLSSLTEKLNNGDKLEILTDRNPEALSVVRHSCSHIMAQAIQSIYPQAKLAIGPAIENGFYYDFDIDGVTLKEEDFPAIEAKMQELISQN